MKKFTDYITEYINTPKATKAFVIIKPGFLKYRDEIYDYIKNDGFEMFDHTNEINLTKHQAETLYEMHKDKDFYKDLVEYMQDTTEASIWGYEEKDDPIKKMKTIKDHFRDKYGIDDMKNVLHSSDSIENVKRESKIIFN